MLLNFNDKNIQMKFQTGQKVILLDTEYKPAGDAVICEYDELSDKYVVEYTYPDGSKVNNVTVPEERLIGLKKDVQS